MKPVALRCVLALLVVSTVAGAPGAAATRVCPDGVTVAAPDTPNDAVDNVVASYVPEGSTVQVCYDPSAVGCSRAPLVVACVGQFSSENGTGDCAGSEAAYRFTETYVVVQPHPSARVHVGHLIWNECDTGFGSSRLDVVGWASPLIGYHIFWSHDGETCRLTAVVTTAGPVGPAQQIPCVPLVRPPMLPALP